MIPNITEQMLKRMASRARPDVVAAIVGESSAAFEEFKIDDLTVVHHLFAHILVESSYLQKTEENLNYSAPRLVQVWNSRFPSISAATPFAHNPHALANKVYGGRYGNDHVNDGWTYRGQGLLQTTFKANFEAIAKLLNISLSDAMKMVQGPGMFRFAVATFVHVGAVAPAKANNIVASTKAVNGGLIGLRDRRDALHLCEQVMR